MRISSIKHIQANLFGAAAIGKTEFLDIKQAMNDFGLAATEIPARSKGSPSVRM